MKSNVHIIHRKRGKLVETRDVHNVWTDAGRVYLAQMIGEVSPGVYERDDRIKYLGLGVGGVYQHSTSLASPIINAYPVGYAEERYPPDYSLSGYTSGDQYNPDCSTSPLIATLERPIRRTGTQDPYPGDSSDRWFIEPPDLYTTHRTLAELTVHASFDTATGEYVYGTFTQMPVTEAALFTSAAVPTGSAYQTAVAYVAFDMILLDATSQIELIWRVRLG